MLSALPSRSDAMTQKGRIGEDNLWIGKAGDSITYTFDDDVEIKDIRLVFDSDINRTYHNMPCCYPLIETNFKLPSTLITEYKIEGISSCGILNEIHVNDNHLRFVRHSVDWKVKTVRFVPISTNGSDNFRLFSFEVN